MRITAREKIATRQRILRSARQLLAARGFDATTTRDLAQAAGIAAGTLFNYFPSKEAVLSALAREALAAAEADFARRATTAATLEEELFAYIAAGLRRLRPLRRHLGPVLETELGPLAAGRAEADSLRARHLETVSALAIGRGRGELAAVALQLYWTLYTGVLSFWTRDNSPKQEDTLALLDESLAMFLGWLGEGECGTRNAEGEEASGPAGAS